MLRKIAGLLLLFAFASLASAQSRSASGTLQVSLTVVSSTLWIEQPDGSFRLVVANAPGGQELKNMQLAVNRPPIPSPGVVTVPLVSPAGSAHSKRTHRR